MESFKAFNIYLLTLMILIGSILNVHVHSDQISRAETETSKEIETASHKGNDFPWLQEFLLVQPSIDYEVSQIVLPVNHSQNNFTTPQLLEANRIALPPPAFS